MVKLLVGILISFWSMLSFGGVKVYPQKVMLGEPVFWVFSGANVEADFAKFDKTDMKKHFEIFDIDGQSDYLRLTLYPLETGKLSLPEIHEGQIAFSGVEVEVVANPDVQIEWQAPLQASPEKPAYVNQMLIWQAKVTLNNAADAASLELHPHAKKTLQHLFQAMPIAESKVLFAKRVDFAMGILSEEPRETQVRSPIIRVKNRGQRPWLFFDKTRTVQFHPLPSYLPSNIPLSSLELSQTRLPYFVPYGELLTWKLRLSATNIVPQTLPSLGQQVRYADKVDSGIEWLTPDLQAQSVWQASGYVTQQAWSLPLRINQLGFFQLPPLRLTYFDVASQQLKDVWLPASKGFAVPKGLFTAMQIFGWILVGIVAWFVLNLLRVWMLKRLLILRLKRADSLTALWQACQEFMLSRKLWLFGLGDRATVNALTVEQTMTITAEATDVSHETMALIGLFNAAFYQPQEERCMTEAKTAALVWASQWPIIQSFWNELRTIRYFLKAMPKA